MLPYIAVARLTAVVKRSCAGLKEWTALDENYAVGEVWLHLHGWTTQQRFVVLREQVREGKSAVGRLLLDVPGYTYRIFVTHRSESDSRDHLARLQRAGLYRTAHRGTQKRLVPPEAFACVAP